MAFPFLDIYKPLNVLVPLYISFFFISSNVKASHLDV